MTFGSAAAEPMIIIVLPAIFQSLLQVTRLTTSYTMHTIKHNERTEKYGNHLAIH